MKVKLVASKPVFTISLIVCALTIVGVWLLGIGQHRTVIENSILSTTILSIAFMFFLVGGLYSGIKLHDNIGPIANSKVYSRLSKFKDVVSLPDMPDIDGDAEGIGGVILAVILWIAVTILLLITIWMFGTLFWIMVITFVAMLYWIFYRALRLVFKKSAHCKGKLGRSMLYGLAYTLLYNFWIYGIIFISQMIIN